jgi:hypothetical protein
MYAKIYYYYYYHYQITHFYDLSLFMPMDFVSPCSLQANNFTKEVLKMFIKIH